jgi:hypothetical protein
MLVAPVHSENPVSAKEERTLYSKEHSAARPFVSDGLGFGIDLREAPETLKIGTVQ